MGIEESHRIECKQNRSDDCLKVISAMANSNGGVVYIGLNDHGNPVELINMKKLLEDISNTIRNKLNLLPAVELNVRKIHKVNL